MIRYDCRTFPDPVMKKTLGAEELRTIRRLSRASQKEFWRKFGVTQSAGSHFENGRALPLPLALLLRVYAMGKICDQDLIVTNKSVMND